MTHPSTVRTSLSLLEYEAYCADRSKCSSNINTIPRVRTGTVSSRTHAPSMHVAALRRIAAGFNGACVYVHAYARTCTCVRFLTYTCVRDHGRAWFVHVEGTAVSLLDNFLLAGGATFAHLNVAPSLHTRPCVCNLGKSIPAEAMQGG